MLEVKIKNTTITMLTNKHQILWKVVYIVKYFTMFLCLFCVTWCFSDNWTSMKVLQWLLVYKKQNGFRNGPLNIVLLVTCKKKQLSALKRYKSWILQYGLYGLLYDSILRTLNILWILLPFRKVLNWLSWFALCCIFKSNLRNKVHLQCVTRYL